MRLYVATTNAGKLRDFARVAEDARGDRGAVDIVPLPGLKEIAAPAEDEPTFEGNARVKAVYYSGFAPGELVVADDSGLEVECLEGAPGVRSARYAEDQAAGQGFPEMPASTQDERNNAALLRAMDSVPEHCRGARYRCALALARDGKVVAMAEGSVEGVILNALQGEGGFGYDPLFLLKEHGQTMAEVEPGVRMEASHRGRAMRRLLEELREGGAGLGV